MERLLLDVLTGAYQRAGLAGLLVELANEHALSGKHFALAMLDVDHLKTLNDVYGHATGDAALRAVAERASRVMRSHDLLFRYGGDEFLLVLPGTTHDVAEAVARRVRDQVIANPVEAAVWVNVNISVGVAATDEPGSGGSGEELFERADARLYLAKRDGRNTVVATDAPSRREESGELRESRLVGRDEHLQRIDAFLAATVTEWEERVLQLTGPAGVGFTRLLNEVEVRAAIAGKTVLRLDSTPADKGVHLRALARAYGDRLPPDPTSEEVRVRLARDAEAHGLVVLAEGGEWLDAGSRVLLQDRLRRGGAKLVEAVPAGRSSAFAAGAAVELAPLSAAQTAEWLSAGLGAAMDAATAEAFAGAGGGLPARTARLVQRIAAELERQGGVASAERIASFEPTRIMELGQEERACARAAAVPQWDTPLIGRAQWIEGAMNVVRSAPLSVLVGPGGVGKSRLAAQLALESGQEFPGGAHWVDLRAVRDAALVPGLISEAVGLEREDDLEALVGKLPPEPTLLVLDEVDGVADSVGWVSALIRGAPQVKLLATSRMPLRLAGEVHLSVPELSLAAATELFRYGMQRVGAGEDVTGDEIEGLIGELGSSPLAVELAAAWTPSLTLEEMSQRLRESPEALTRPADRAPNTTRFIDVTRDLMSDHEREALGLLAFIPAGFTSDIARSAANVSPFFLLALLERSLVRREGERFTVHAAIAERYREAVQDPHAGRLRVARAYSELAKRINRMSARERDSRGYRIADAERANLFYSVRQVAAEHDAEATWNLVRLLRGYLDVRGRAREGLELFRQLDQLLEGSPGTELRGWVGETTALYRYQLGQLPEAAATIRSVLRRLEPLGATYTLGLAFNTHAMILATGGEYAGALEAFERSATVREQLGEAVGEAQARGNIAIVLLQMGEYERALGALKESLRKYEAVQHYSGVAVAQISIASLGRESGLVELPERVERARAALELAESFGYATLALDAASELAYALHASGRLADAEAALLRALEWDGAHGEPTPNREPLNARLQELRLEREESLQRAARAELPAPSGR